MLFFFNVLFITTATATAIRDGDNGDGGDDRGCATKVLFISVLMFYAVFCY